MWIPRYSVKICVWRSFWVSPLTCTMTQGKKTKTKSPRGSWQQCPSWRYHLHPYGPDLLYSSQGHLNHQPKRGGEENGVWFRPGWGPWHSNYRGFAICNEFAGLSPWKCKSCFCRDNFWPSTAGTFRKKFRKNSGKTPETLSERFLEFPSRVRLGSPKPYSSRHLRLPEHIQNSLAPSTAGGASLFRSGSGEGLSELVMEFLAVLRVFLNYRRQGFLSWLFQRLFAAWSLQGLRWPWTGLILTRQKWH